MINFEEIIGLQVVTSGAHIIGEVKGAIIPRLSAASPVSFTFKNFINQVAVSIVLNICIIFSIQF